MTPEYRGYVGVQHFYGDFPLEQDSHLTASTLEPQTDGYQKTPFPQLIPARKD